MSTSEISSTNVLCDMVSADTNVGSCIPAPTQFRPILDAAAAGSDDIRERLTDLMFRSQPSIKNEIDKLALNNVQNHILVENAKDRYNLSQVCSNDQIAYIQDCYPMFRIYSEIRSTQLNHAVARETRGLDFALILKMIGAHDDHQLLHHKFLFKDVGGNPIVHDRLKIRQSHVCRPYLGYKDVSRIYNDAQYFESVSVRARADISAHPFAGRLLRDEKVICNNMAQHCKETAKYVIFCHSTYDITPDEIGDIMISANAEAGYACFLYDPNMILHTSGFMPELNCEWNIEKENGMSFITFTFRDEMCVCYRHNLRDYLSLAFVNFIKCSNGDVYIVEPIFYTNYTVFVRFIRHPKGSVLPETIIRTHCFPCEDAFYVLRTYKYDTLLSVTNNYNHVKAVDIMCPKTLYVGVRKYALQLDATKFTYEAVKKATVSMSSRVIVNGVAIRVPNVDKDDLSSIALFIYMETFIENWEQGRMLQLSVEDEKSVRDISIYRVIARYLFAHTSSSHPNGDRALDVSGFLDQDLSLIRQGTATPGAPFFNGFFKFLNRIFTVQRKYPISKISNRRLEFREVIHLAAPILSGGFEYSSVTLLSEVARARVSTNESLRLHSLGEKYRRALEKPRVDISHSADLDYFVQRDVPGDGNCFYHAFARSLNIPDDPAVIRTRLLRSDFLRLLFLRKGDQDRNSDVMRTDTDHVERLVKRLRPSVDPTDQNHWADEDVILVASFEYSVTVVLHTDHYTRCFNQAASGVASGVEFGTRVHLRHKNGHYTYLEYKGDISPIDIQEIHAISGGQVVDFNLPAFSNQISGLTVRNEGVVPIKKYSDVARQVSRISGVSTPFGDFFGATVGNICRDLGLLANVSTVLDFNITTTTSCTEFFQRCTSCDLTAVSFGRVRGYVRSREMAHVTVVNSNFDVITESYDLVNINPLIYSDDLLVLDSEKYDTYLKKITSVYTKVSAGGNLLLPIALPPTNYQLRLLTFLCDRFDNVSIVRSKILPEYSPWLIVVCKSLKKVITPFDIDLIDITQINSGVVVSAECFCENAVLEVANIADHIISGADSRMDDVLSKNRDNWIPSVTTAVGGFDFSRVTSAVTSVTVQMHNTLSNIWLHICKGSPSGYVYTPSGDYYKIKGYHSKINYDHSCLLYTHVLKHYGIDRSVTDDVLLDKIRNESDDYEFGRYYLTCLLYYRSLGKTFVPIEFDTCKKCPITTIHVVRPKLGNLKSLLLTISSRVSCPDKIESPNLRIIYDRFQELNPPKIVKVDRPVNSFMSQEFKNAVDNELARALFAAPYYSVVPPDSSLTIDSSSESEITGGSTVVWDDGSYSCCKDKNYKPVFDEFLYLNKLTVDNTMSNVRSLVGACKAFMKGSDKTQLVARFAKYKKAVVRIGNRFIIGSKDDCRGHRYFVNLSPSPSVSDVLDAGQFALQTMPDFDKFQGYKNFFCFDDTEVFFEKDLQNTMKEELQLSDNVDFHIVQAGPGCGKTHEIVQRAYANIRDVVADKSPPKMLVVVKNRVSADDVRGRICKEFGKALTDKVRMFIDTMVVSIDRSMEQSDKGLSYDIILVDEGMIHHPGKILAMANSCAGDTCEVVIYGDVFQIGYICRVNTEVEHRRYIMTSKAFPVSRMLRVTYRCPKDVTLWLSAMYRTLAVDLGLDDGTEILTSVNDAAVPSVTHEKVHDISVIPNYDDVQYLTFSQQCKDKLIKHGYKKTMTIHEFQGNQSEKVFLVRDVATQTPTTTLSGENVDLYESKTHIVSGLSRHSKQLVYYTVIEDQLVNIIKGIKTSYDAYIAK